MTSLKVKKKSGRRKFSRLSRLFPLQHALHNQKWCEIGGPTPEICSKSDVLSVNPSTRVVRIADSAPTGTFRRPPRARTWVPEGVRGIPVTAPARSPIVPAIFRSGFAVGAVWRPWQAAREAWQRVDSSTDAARSAQPATPGIKSVRRVH